MTLNMFCFSSIIICLYINLLHIKIHIHNMYMNMNTYRCRKMLLSNLDIIGIVRPFGTLLGAYCRAEN